MSSSSSPNPRQEAARRRDWRALPDTPEVPPHQPHRQDQRLCPRAQEHTPELVLAEDRHSIDIDAHHLQWDVTLQRWSLRCSLCHQTDLDPTLLAPFADRISSDALSHLLGARWCPRGHDYVDTTFDDKSGKVCCRCGRGRRPYVGPAIAIKDIELLLGAGIPLAAAERIAARPAMTWGDDLTKLTRVRV